MSEHIGIKYETQGINFTFYTIFYLYEQCFKIIHLLSSIIYDAAALNIKSMGQRILHKIGIMRPIEVPGIFTVVNLKATLCQNIKEKLQHFSGFSFE